MERICVEPSGTLLYSNMDVAGDVKLLDDVLQSYLLRGARERPEQCGWYLKDQRSDDLSSHITELSGYLCYAKLIVARNIVENSEPYV